jgi:hypothetical protein
MNVVVVQIIGQELLVCWFFFCFVFCFCFLKFKGCALYKVVCDCAEMTVPGPWPASLDLWSCCTVTAGGGWRFHSCGRSAEWRPWLGYPPVWLEGTGPSALAWTLISKSSGASKKISTNNVKFSKFYSVMILHHCFVLDVVFHSIYNSPQPFMHKNHIYHIYLPLDSDDQQFYRDTRLCLFVSHPAESTDICMHDEAKNVPL